MRLLLAFDKFKGALTAAEACQIAAGVAVRELPGCEVEEVPLTDGGEGFCESLTLAASGTLERVPVADPLGRTIQAPLGWVDANRLPDSILSSLSLPSEGRIAVVEMAAASGLLLLRENERDPWETETGGTGQLMRHATERGASGIVLGIGGSATNDAGCGALAALGVRFIDGDGKELGRIRPSLFEHVDQIRWPEKLDLPPIRIASDVESPLLGPMGATAVFGPQKGLQEVGRMEAALTRMAFLLQGSAPGSPDPAATGMGAAGGIAYGLSAVAGIRLHPGFELVSAWLGLEEKLREADWVLTGEGRLDAGSLRGKGPVALLRRAQRYGLRTALFAGAIQPDALVELKKEIAGIRTEALSDPSWSLELSLAKAGERLEEEIRKFCHSLP